MANNGGDILEIDKDNIHKIFQVYSYKIFQGHNPCMGWDCFGGVCKEGNVLKFLRKQNNQTLSDPGLLSTQWKLLVISRKQKF